MPRKFRVIRCWSSPSPVWSCSPHCVHPHVLRQWSHLAVTNSPSPTHSTLLTGPLCPWNVTIGVRTGVRLRVVVLARLEEESSLSRVSSGRLSSGTAKEAGNITVWVFVWPVHSHNYCHRVTLYVPYSASFSWGTKFVYLENGGFHEQTFCLVSLPALHSYVPVSHAYVKISWRSACPRK